MLDSSTAFSTTPTIFLPLSSWRALSSLRALGPLGPRSPGRAGCPSGASSPLRSRGVPRHRGFPAGARGRGGVKQLLGRRRVTGIDLRRGGGRAGPCDPAGAQRRSGRGRQRHPGSDRPQLSLPSRPDLLAHRFRLPYRRIRIGHGATTPCTKTVPRTTG